MAEIGKARLGTSWSSVLEKAKGLAFRSLTKLPERRRSVGYDFRLKGKWKIIPDPVKIEIVIDRTRVDVAVLEFTSTQAPAKAKHLCSEGAGTELNTLQFGEPRFRTLLLARRKKRKTTAGAIDRSK